MNWQLIRLDDVAASPWRNGGGVTRELLAWPEAADWSCRLSVAEVTQDGPFSRFDGVQRCFAVLDGAGVRLGMNGQWFDLDRHSAPFAFDGAVPVDCRLLAGPTRDFNLMVRQPLGPALMRRVAGNWSTTLEKSKLIAMYSIMTGAEARFGSNITARPARCLAWQLVPAGAEVGLSAAEALWMEVSL